MRVLICWVKGHNKERGGLERFWFVVIYNIYGSGGGLPLRTSLFCRAIKVRPRGLSLPRSLSQLKLACRNQTEGLLGEDSFLSWEVKKGWCHIILIFNFGASHLAGYSP